VGNNSLSHQDVVRKLLDSKAVDFNAIGKAFAEMGPSLALMDEPGDGFCGTMRYFIRIFRPWVTNPDPDPNPVQTLE
jgi:hypothetical protein